MCRLLHAAILGLWLAGWVAGCGHTPTTPDEGRLTAPQAHPKMTYWRELLARQPDAVEARMELGKLLLAGGAIAEARTQFEHVLRVAPRHVHAQLFLALAYQKPPKPDFSQAQALLEKAVGIAPANAELHLHLAQVYSQRAIEGLAIQEFQQALALSQDPAVQVAAHLGLMALYTKQGEPQKAQAAYEAAFAIYPGVATMLKQADIRRITPAPRYAGAQFRAGDGIHPELEERIRRLQLELLQNGKDHQ